jgi:hypothetical protein
LFLYDLVLDIVIEVATNVASGNNDLDAQFWPSEGGLIWTTKGVHTGAIPTIFLRPIENAIHDDLLFSAGFMPDWE